MTDVQQIRRRLLTYSMVSHHIGQSGDPIAALVPFFAPIANDNAGQEFDPAKFRDEMRGRYGLTFSGDVTEIFVERLLSLSIIKRHSTGKPVWIKQSAEGDAAKSDSGILDRVIVTARELHETRSDLLTIPFDDEPFLESLLNALLDQNAQLSDAISAIATAGGGEALKQRSRTAQQYFAAEYVTWARENDPEIFAWLADLTGTALVTEALVEIRTPPANSNVRPELTVYLDAPLLMELLGCSGAAARQDAKFVVDTLQSLRIPVAAFSHSVEEMRSNLQAVLKAEVRTGPTAAALLYREVQEGYLTSVLNRTEDFLDEAHVGIHKTNDGSIDRGYFSEAEEQNFYARLYGHYQNETARERDVRSVVWVVCRRRGESRRDILKSKHLLLTRNDKLVRLADQFCRERLRLPKGTAGPAITARDMAGVLWLLVGSRDRQELSKRQMLLSCQRARASAPEVVHAMVETLRGVNKENADLLWAAAQKPQYQVMMLDAAVSSGAVSINVAEATIEAIRADLVAAERQRHKQERQAIEARYDAEAALMKLVNQKAEEENQLLADEQAALLESLRLVSQKTWQRHRGGAKLVYWGAVAVLNLLVVAATFYAAYVSSADQFSVSSKTIVTGLVGVVILYLGNYLGLGSLRRWIGNRLTGAYRSKIEALSPRHADEILISEPVL